MKLTDLLLNRFLYKNPLQDLETKDSIYDSSNVIAETPPPLASGGAAQDINTGNVYINGNQLEPGTFPTTVLDVSNWGWGQTCAFTSVDQDTVSWGGGAFKSSSGTVYTIGAGSTGNMAAKTYIYLDLLVSDTAYQITTTPGNAVGIGKVLVAVAENASAGNLATYNLNEATQIVGDNILANSINASKIVAGSITTSQLNFTPAQTSNIIATINGSTEGAITINASKININGTTTFSAGYDPTTKLPTASAGSLAYLNSIGASNVDTTIISGGKIITGLLTASNIQTGTLDASLITVNNLSASSITTGTLSGISISIGSGNNIFKADANGIYLGNATFGSAPFRVSMAGDVTASSITLTNASVGAGSSWTGNSIASAYIGNLDAAKITSGTITVGAASQPGEIQIIQSSAGGGGTTTALLDWRSSAGGTIRGKIWADSSGYMGYNAIGGNHYFYGANNQILLLQNGGRSIFYQTVGLNGVYLYGNSGSSESLYGGNVGRYEYNASTYHYFNINGNLRLRVSDAGTTMYSTDGAPVLLTNWIQVTGTAAQIGTSAARFYIYGSTVRGTSAYINDSDIRLKKEIKNSSYGLKEIKLLEPISYKLINEEYGLGTHLGFSAQSVEKLIPEVVSEDSESGFKGIAYTELIPALVKSIQELSNEVEELRKMLPK
jgi:hypothetical protein